MMAAKHDSHARRALRPAALILLTATTLTAAAACSSSSSTPSSAGTSTAGGTASAATTSAGLAKYLPGKNATGTPVKIGLINNEGSSPVAEPSTGDAAVAAADYATPELGGVGGDP